MKYPLSPDVKPEFCTTGSFMRLPASRENAKLAVLGIPFDTGCFIQGRSTICPTGNPPGIYDLVSLPSDTQGVPI